jgi:single-strand DNA-binding protein
MSQRYAEIDLQGRLTDKPTLQDVAGNHKVGHMTLAVDRPGKDKGTDFFRATTWDKQPETCHQYLDKGDMFRVKGRPEIQEWEKDGQKHRSLDVHVEKLIFLDNQRSRDTQAAANDSPDR